LRFIRLTAQGLDLSSFCRARCNMPRRSGEIFALGNQPKVALRRGGILISENSGGGDKMDNGSLIEDLEEAIARASSERRDEALRQVPNLFISGAGRYSEDQIGLFDEVIGRLASVIEAKARVKLASRLAPVPTAPVNVIRALAADEAID